VPRAASWAAVVKRMVEGSNDRRTKTDPNYIFILSNQDLNLDSNGNQLGHEERKFPRSFFFFFLVVSTIVIVMYIS
jgi:hypothetical protein